MHHNLKKLTKEQALQCAARVVTVKKLEAYEDDGVWFLRLKDTYLVMGRGPTWGDALQFMVREQVKRRRADELSSRIEVDVSNELQAIGALRPVLYADLGALHVAELRELVKWADRQPEGFVMDLDIGQLTRLWRCHMACDWSYPLTHWTEGQRALAANEGVVPEFDDG